MSEFIVNGEEFLSLKKNYRARNKTIGVLEKTPNITVIRPIIRCLTKKGAG